VLCVGIFYFYNHPKEMDKETKALLKEIYSYSGKLTPDQGRNFFESVQMLDAKHLLVPLPDSELTRLGKHMQELHRDNPDFHPHNPLGDMASEIHELIARINDTDLPADRKQQIISNLQHLHKVANDDSIIRKLERIAKESKVSISYDINTGRILKMYPNTVYLHKNRIREPDGTVRETLLGHSHSLDPDDANRELVDAYLSALENLDPDGTAPTPPDGIRFIDIYEPENPILKAISGGVDELPADIGRKELHIGNGHEHDHQPNPSVPDATTSDAPHPSPDEQSVTDSNIMRDRLANQLTHEAELKRLLNMSDAELEAELERLLTPKLRTEERLKTVRREPSLTGKNLPRISPERLEKARAILNRYGQEGGLRRLRASDPEVARQMEQMLQSGPPSNPQKEGKRAKPE
jgi:hypothetical protein